MLGLDRRVIFLLITLAVLLPLIRPVGFPVRISPEVKKVYEFMESLPPRSTFLLSMDFDPASKAELHPMAIALLRHAFRKNLRVIGMTLWVTGTGMANDLLTQAAGEAGKQSGQDYVFLGFSPGGSSVILSMGQDLKSAFPKDHEGRPVENIPLLQGIHSLRDIEYVVSLAAGNPGIEAWYVFGKEKYGFELGGGCTAVSAPGLYPLLNTGQINGLLGGLRGAAEYETLIDRKDKAVGGMDAQSATHMVIIFLILISNAFYFVSRRGDRR
jgi:hypothetical protein